ncbi:hypothetical protein B0T20DRAFT_129105 [Sordaria brevicollis]|uniref:Uncharacterized protein n=1 Tax=Sordaria brevicollis TaxID=83679 RepID=A0AAE0UFE0_SORBR|nr:hypothetical protein B0T20DRAFT_129105 [Sordaria brevicollis]
MAAGLSSALRTARHRVPSAAVRNYSRSTTPAQQPAWGPATCGGKDYSSDSFGCGLRRPFEFPHQHPFHFPQPFPSSRSISPTFTFLAFHLPRVLRHKSHDSLTTSSLLQYSWHFHLASCFFCLFALPVSHVSMLLRVHDSSCILRPHPPENVTSTFLSPPSLHSGALCYPRFRTSFSFTSPRGMQCMHWSLFASCLKHCSPSMLRLLGRICTLPLRTYSRGTTPMRAATSNSTRHHCPIPKVVGVLDMGSSLTLKKAWESSNDTTGETCADSSSTARLLYYTIT